MRGPAHTILGWALSLSLSISLVACVGAPDPAPAPLSAGRVMPAAVEDFAANAWAGRSEADEVVARVGVAPITLSTLRRAAEASPETPVAEVLERLIELEVLAQEAMGRG